MAKNRIYGGWSEQKDSKFRTTTSQKEITLQPDANSVQGTVTIPAFNSFEEVLDILANPPVSPNLGDRYLISAPATGAWVGQEDSIAEWNGASWDFTAPIEDYYLNVADEPSIIYKYSGGSWASQATALDNVVTEEKAQTLDNKRLNTPKINEDVELSSTATELNQLSGVSIGGNASGDVVTTDDTQTLTNKTIDASQLVDASIATAKLADDSVTADKVNADVAGLGLGQNVDGSLEVNTAGGLEISGDDVQIADSGVSTAKIADNAVTPAKLDPTVAGLGLTQAAGGELDVNVDGTSLEVATDTVQIADSGVSTAKLADDSVTAAKVNADVAGDGLVQDGVDGSLDVNPGTGLEISGDTVAVAAGGIGTTELADDSVTAAKLNADTAGLGLSQAAGGELDVNTAGGLEISGDNVQIADSGVSTAKLADDSVTAAKLNADTAGLGLNQGASGELNVNTTGGLEISGDDVQIADLGVSTAKLADDSVTAAKVNADVAGDGLVQDGVDGSLDVNVDNSTLEINADTVRVAAGGITDNEINDVAAGKITGTLVDAQLPADVVYETDTQNVSNKTFDNIRYTATTASISSGAIAKSASAIIHELQASEATLSTITAGVDGDVLILVNDTGVDVTITNDAGADGIITGTGAGIALTDTASLSLIYDASASRWTVVGGSGSGGGSGGLSLSNLSATTTALANTHYLVDSSGGAFTVTLPAGAAGSIIRFSDVVDSWGTNNVTIEADGAETIDGDASLILDVNGVWTQLMWDGTEWKTDDPFEPELVDLSGDLSISGTLTAEEGIITKDEAVADLTVASGYTLTHPNLTIASGVTYTINGSLLVP